MSLARSYLTAVPAALVCVLLAVAPATAEAPSFQVRVTQVDRSAFPKITVYVSVTDSAGKPVPADQAMSVEVLEGSERVLTAELSDGKGRRQTGPVTVSLVIDCSGSMSGEKIEKARVAAEAFVRLAPAHYEIGLIRFDGQVVEVCSPTKDRARLTRA